MYFDPPYYIQGSTLYLNAYDPVDHKTLAEVIQSDVSHRWIVSYDNVTAISDLYAERRQQEFSLAYSAQLHYQGSELMIFGDDVKAPERIYAARTCK